MQNEGKYSGIIPPVVVPDTEDRELDVASFERLLEHLIAGGVHGLFILGSSGEVVFSTDERRDEVVREAKRIIAGRVPMLVGIIDTQTERVIEQGERALALGADALVATAPFYALCGPAQIEEHFRVLASALDAPIYAYDIPVCVHSKLDWKMLLRLGREGVLAGVKDSSGDDISFRYLCQENEKAGSPMSVLTGHEMVVDGALLSGADGAVPGLANLDPASYVQMYELALAGKWEEVRQIQNKLNEISHIFDVTSGVTGYGAGVGAFKTALMLMGIFTSNQMPRPVTAQGQENIDAIRSVLESCGLLS